MSKLNDLYNTVAPIASGVAVNSSGFTGNLSTDIETVQDALVEIDSLELGISSATSYANRGGTGSRHNFVTITTNAPLDYTRPSFNAKAFLDGMCWHSAASFQDAPVADTYIRFQFDRQVVIDAVTFYQEGSCPQGYWQWQGSNNGTSWTNIGEDFELGAYGDFSAQVITAMSANTTAYLYYQLLGVSGSGAGIGYANEFEFKISI